MCDDQDMKGGVKMGGSEHSTCLATVMKSGWVSGDKEEGAEDEVLRPQWA